ncbi:hypothetical protein H072_8561 [Dactylellina haptotyla CBS 200.50]|uniref:Ribosomal protein L19 n=1 Tax=Dactylellina haptotyla (strain CBS 200.50) TaxID=1284197 RepID=S8BEJ3_DACHA|nr:hypothetical protein H072_8561 [Dactylellina haptotyla CBS 200.50]
MSGPVRTGLSRLRDALPFSAGPKPKSVQPVLPAAAAVIAQKELPSRPRAQSIDQLLAQLGTKKPVVPERDPKKPPPKRIRVNLPLGPAPPKNPLALFTAAKLKKMDPKGLRARLFSRHNKDAILPGDILQVRFADSNTEPFAGVLINIRRRGLDTAFLLRNHLTRVGVEMWYKLYSPKIAGIDLVERKARRAKRAKLYFMRQPKHDMGSVESIVSRWKKNRMLFGGGDLDAEKGKGKKGAEKGKKGKK